MVRVAIFPIQNLFMWSHCWVVSGAFFFSDSEIFISVGSIYYQHCFKKKKRHYLINLTRLCLAIITHYNIQHQTIQWQVTISLPIKHCVVEDNMINRGSVHIPDWIQIFTQIWSKVLPYWHLPLPKNLSSSLMLILNASLVSLVLLVLARFGFSPHQMQSSDLSYRIQLL